MSAFVISRPEPSVFKIAVLRESNKTLHIALDNSNWLQLQVKARHIWLLDMMLQYIFAGLTLHADAGIRAQAVAVMKRILRGVPRMRNAMLLGVAGLAARIPDDTPEVIELGTHKQNCMLYLNLHQGQLCSARAFTLLFNKLLPYSAVKQQCESRCTAKLVLMQLQVEHAVLTVSGAA